MFRGILVAELRVPLVSAVSLLRQQMEDRSLWIGLTTTTASLIPTPPPGPQSFFSPVWPAPAESPTSCTWSNRAGIWAIGGWSWPETLAEVQRWAHTQDTKSHNWHSLSYPLICLSSSTQILCQIKVRICQHISQHYWLKGKTRQPRLSRFCNFYIMGAWGQEFGVISGEVQKKVCSSALCQELLL